MHLQAIRQQRIQLWPAQAEKMTMLRDRNISELSMEVTRPNKSIIQVEWMGPYNRI